MLAVVAHGLLGPVSTLLGYAEILSTRWDDLPDERRRQMVETIRTRGELVAGMLHDLVSAGMSPEVEAFLDRLGWAPRHASGEAAAGTRHP
ncbi:MAG TPA: histidine kinase dimerization/phospho-acceptor domain-containing protein [Acidimicrobiales bacterium]|nr:histidine kinase dimerization/phospho-acceptor domain-containing protein [Acidimicrobiales bacterium]